MKKGKKRLGLIQVYTGNGKGKTTAALGIALRAAGRSSLASCWNLACCSVTGRPTTFTPGCRSSWKVSRFIH